MRSTAERVLSTISTSHIYREIFLPLASRCARTINSVASSTWYIHCTLHNIYIYFINQYLSIQKPGYVCIDNTYGFFVTLTLIFIIIKYIYAHIYILMTVCICVCLSEELEIYSLKYFYMFWKTCITFAYKETNLLFSWENYLIILNRERIYACRVNTPDYWHPWVSAYNGITSRYFNSELIVTFCEGKVATFCLLSDYGII